MPRVMATESIIDPSKDHHALVGLARSQIIDCEHGKRPYADDEGFLIDEKVRAMVNYRRELLSRFAVVGSFEIRQSLNTISPPR
jgi:hypothetical protein